MNIKITLFSLAFILMANTIFSQTRQDSLEIKQSALDYIESQHRPNPVQMEHALHPRMVKRTSWKDKSTGKDYIRETATESMVLLDESYNKDNDKFPPSPTKEVKLLDVSERTASVKLTADDWIDYLHIVKLNGTWKIINVLWQFKDTGKH